MQSPLESEPEVIQIPTPGTLLRKQRKAYGWSLNDVANSLRLSIKQVELIEADDFDALPGATYIQGYWQSYSRLLELDISESVQAHRGSITDKKAIIAPNPSHQQIRGSEEQSRRRVALVFCVLLSVFLGMVWYLQTPGNKLATSEIGQQIAGWLNPVQESSISISDDTNRATSVETGQASVAGNAIEPGVADNATSIISLPVPNFSDDSEESQGTIENQSLEVNNLLNSVTDQSNENLVSAGVNAGSGNETLLSGVPEENTEVDNGNGEVADSVATEAADDSSAANVTLYNAESSAEGASVEEAAGEDATGEDATEEVAGDDAVQLTGTATASSNSNPTTQESLASNTEESSESVNMASLDSSNSSLHFQLKRETWLDVRDYRGEKLVYETIPENQQISVQGTSPFYVFIGSAEGVVVYYKGQEYPFEINESGSFARFSVGKEDQ